MPRLANSMGYFVRIPQGRAYLVEVPGVATAPLSDEEIAEVLNWMLLTFSRPQLPAHFTPYTAAEISKYRMHKLIDVAQTRRRLAAQLKSMGFSVAEGGKLPPATAPAKP